MEVIQKEKLETADADKLELIDLPSLALDKVVEFLDYGSRKTSRVVCQKLRSHVNNVGLAVKIDSRHKTSTDFCKSVNVTQAHIVFLKKGQLDLDPEHFQNWKIAILSGLVDTNWILNSFFRKSIYLRILIIREECLIAQDFQNPKEPIPLFEHLMEVEFFLSSEGYDATDKLKAMDERELTFRDFMRFHVADTRLQMNLTCLLTNIRSRVLKVFTGFVMTRIEQADSLSQVQHWEHKPLYEFLEYHRNTLEVIILPALFSDETPKPYPVCQQPTKLKLFHYRSSLGEVFIYWKDLLLAQNSLQTISLAGLPYLNRTLPLLQSALTNNATTLTHVYVHFGSETGKIASLDMKMFKGCESLKCLVLHCGCPMSMTKKMMLHNLNDLPHTRLTTLKLICVEIGPDFDGVKFMEDGFNPKALNMLEVSTSGFFINKQYLLKFIELVLRCRNLDVFSLKLNLSPQDSGIQSWKTHITTATLDEIGLKVWIANLRAKEPANHRGLYLDFSDIRNIKALAPGPGGSISYSRPASSVVPKDRKPIVSVPSSSEDNLYVEREGSGAVNLDFIGLTNLSDISLDRKREPPFYIPRNADSYTIWDNQQTNAYKIEANTKSYSKRVNNIQERFRITMMFFIDQRAGDEFRPLDVNDFI